MDIADKFLCRARRIDNGSWVEGFVLCGAEHTYIMSEDVPPVLPGGDMAANIPLVPVQPESVGRYVGRLDKHGAKIFQGDVLRGPRPDYLPRRRDAEDTREIEGVVVWDEKGYHISPGGWYLDVNDSTGFPVTIPFDEEWEVVGNIFERGKGV